MGDTKTIYLAVTVPVDFEMPQAHHGHERAKVVLKAATYTPSFYETTDAISKEADRIKAAEYQETVRDVAKGIIDAVRAGEVTDWDDLETRLHEDIDGHHDVIYTYAAMQVILHSSNDSAYFEDFGDEGAVEDGAIQWSRLAYAALMADVREELQRSDEIDMDEDDLGYFECEDCEKRFQRSAWESEETDLCTGCEDKRANAEALKEHEDAVEDGGTE
jgi:hypothetical protein